MSTTETPLRIIAVGAVKHALQHLLRTPGLPEATASFDTVGGARDKVLAGTPCDLVIASDPALDILREAGRLTGERLALGRTGLGFAVPEGAAPLDTSSPAAIAATLRAAPRIAMADPASGATAGRHFQGILDQLGLTDTLAPKITRHANGMLAVAEVVEGRASIAVSQMTEIVPVPGVDLGGTLPEAMQLWTVYAASLAAGGDARAGAWLALFASPAGQEAFAATGFVA